MAELAALNVRLTGDSANLRSALQSAEDGLENLSAQAQKTVRQTTLATGSMGRLGSVFQRNSFAISNAANQFSDLAVQIGAGTPAARALSQQLPQMTAMMGPLATVIGVASGVLIGLAGNFFSAAEEASTFTDALDELSSIQGNVKRSQDILSMSVDELTTKYGQYAQAVLNAAISTAKLSEVQAQQKLSAALADVNGALDGFTQRAGSAFRSGTMLTTAIGNIAEQFGVTREQARQLEGAFRTLEAATTFEQQVEALREIERLMTEVGADASQLPPPLIEALQQLNAMVIASAELSGALDTAGASANRLRAAMAGMITEGIGFQLSQGGPAPDTSPFQLGTPIGGGTGLPAAPRAGKGAAPVNPLIAQLEQLEQSLMTQEQLEIDSFQRRQQILEDALRQQLLTRQEYANLMEQVEASHQFAMTQQTNQGVSQALGALGNLFQGSKKIGAGVALANSWLAFTEVLKDPSFVGRPFARFAAAASALSAGMNAVRNIRSASTGGGAVSGGAATAGAVSASATGGGVSRNVAISLTGGDMFSRSQVINLINSINEAVEDGAIVRLV